MRKLHLEVSSNPAQLARVRRAVEALCLGCGFDDKSVAEIGLVINEAMANIMRHAYEGATDRPIVIDARFVDDALQIALRDWGNGRDPTTHPDRKDPELPGGLGMVCLRKLMDEVEYAPQHPGMILTMKRKLSRG